VCLARLRAGIPRIGKRVYGPRKVCEYLDRQRMARPNANSMPLMEPASHAIPHPHLICYGSSLVQSPQANMGVRTRHVVCRNTGVQYAFVGGSCVNWKQDTEHLRPIAPESGSAPSSTAVIAHCCYTRRYTRLYSARPAYAPRRTADSLGGVEGGEFARTQIRSERGHTRAEEVATS
jgi:hypothetical protein